MRPATELLDHPSYIDLRSFFSKCVLGVFNLVPGCLGIAAKRGEKNQKEK